MKRRLGIAALIAAWALSFSITAEAEVVRAFWAGSVTDAVSGNAYDLAVGNKLSASMYFDTDWMDTFSGFAPTDSLVVAADFYRYSGQPLMTNGASIQAPIFSGEIRFLQAMVWQVIDAGQIVATGTWSVDSIKFDQRVVPIPAALPLLLGAIGILAGFRRRS